MGWFKRIKEGITTSTRNKKETPQGLWYKCPSCKNVMPTEDHLKAYGVCQSCGYHEKINAYQYLEMLFDEEQYREFNQEFSSPDPLDFEDTKKYKDRLKKMRKDTGLNDAVVTASGRLNGERVVVGVMDFRFIGGSMGSVVGGKVAKAVDQSIRTKSPFIMVSKSGGARMMEAGFSLMQMAKTAAKLTQLERHKIPYLSVLTDPTTGGVTASYAMLGDFNIAEPGALIGFAGPRVIRETMGQDLPEGFQTSEFLLEHGFLDMIVERG